MAFRLTLTVTVTITVAVLVAAPRLDAAPLATKPCDLPGVEGARCATFEVFENRRLGKGRRIGLNVVVLPAVAAKPAPDAVFWLHGGPGAPATEVAGAGTQGFLKELHQDHDLVFVDQRGTGKSHPLQCDIGDDPTHLDVFFGPLFPPELVRRCRAALEKDADLTMYTTPIAMDDLDDVRAALGYAKIDLVAASYGTIAAQVYLRQHGDHVRAAFLLGVATPGVKQPLLFPRGAQHAMDLLYEDCAADDVCGKAFPRLKEELAAVLARFDAGPLRVNLVEVNGGKPRSVLLTRDNFVERLRLLLYTTTFARFVPLVIHRAFENDFLPFESIAVNYNPGGGLARGMYFTVTCSEGVPFISDEELRREAAGTFVGEGRIVAHRNACKEWPRGAVPPGYIDPVRSDVPVLLFSGELDGSTPPWFGKSALQSLPNGVQITARYYGHQFDAPCSVETMDALIAKGSAKAVDGSCAAAIRRPPFATELPPQLSLGRS